MGIGCSEVLGRLIRHGSMWLIQRGKSGAASVWRCPDEVRPIWPCSVTEASWRHRGTNLGQTTGPVGRARAAAPRLLAVAAVSMWRATGGVRRAGRLTLARIRRVLPVRVPVSASRASTSCAGRIGAGPRGMVGTGALPAPGRRHPRAWPTSSRVPAGARYGPSCGTFPRFATRPRATAAGC